MSTSTANVTVTNIPLSPMRVTWGGVDIGGTTGDVTLTKKTLMSPIMVDQYGKTEVEYKVSGYQYSIKFTLAEVLNKANWKLIYPSDLYSSTGTGIIATQMNIGDSMYSKAVPMILHPLEKPNGDLSEDYNMAKVISTQASEVKYGPEKQTGLAVEIHIFPNLGVSPPLFMTFGDPTISLTPASAAAATPGSNTGNGTIGSEAAYSGITLSETITVLCVDSTSGNKFSVQGSLSGALGVFSIAAGSKKPGSAQGRTRGKAISKWRRTQ